MLRHPSLQIRDCLATDPQFLGERRLRDLRESYPFRAPNGSYK